jgi:choline dehydrogenase
MADAEVVGGGSAGCVLAARLSEDAACRVVLLEAGRDLIRLADVPPDVLDASGPTLTQVAGRRASVPRRCRSLPLSFRVALTGLAAT